MRDTPQVLTPAERRRRNHDEVAQQILLAARAVMREYGVAALNLQEVARRVGMRAPSLYNYFPNRTAIYDALFTQEMRHYHERLAETLAVPGSVWERIERGTRFHLAFALEYPELFQLLFERPVPGFVPSEQGLAESAQLLEVGHQATLDALASGELDPRITPDEMSNLLIALNHGIAAGQLANEPHLPPDSSRFGSLVPIVIALLKRAWAVNSEPDQAGL
jgi:AcrR family transcriptional regulator